MKICVYGAGAIGGLMAAWLARAGHEVSLVARGAQLDAIQREKRMKKWNRAWKLELIEKANPLWVDLSKQIF